MCAGGLARQVTDNAASPPLRGADTIGKTLGKRAGNLMAAADFHRVPQQGRLLQRPRMAGIWHVLKGNDSCTPKARRSLPQDQAFRRPRPPFPITSFTLEMRIGACASPRQA